MSEGDKSMRLCCPTNQPALDVFACWQLRCCVFVATRTYVTIYLLLLSLVQQLASVVIKEGRCWVAEVERRNGAGKSQQEQMDLDEGLSLQ